MTTRWISIATCSASRCHRSTPAQLEDAVARQNSDLLDRRRPLWRLFVIDGPLSGQWAYRTQVHHAVLDGLAGVLLMVGGLVLATARRPV